MARGDVIVFEEAKAMMLDGSWLGTDHIYCAVCDDTLTPAAADAAPVIGDYTQVGAAGTYIDGGTDLGAITTLVAEAAGVMTFDSATNPTWAQDPLSDVDAYWGILYNFTHGTADCLAFVELDGPVDMTAGDLTITWNAAGIFTIT